MIKVLSHLTGFLLAGILMVSCKKDNAEEEKQPTDPVDNNIVETRAAVQTAVSGTPIGGSVSGYYQAVPWYYYATTKSYPLIISIPGGGQIGNGTSDLPLLLNDGLAKLIKDKRLPAAFSVNGNAYSFIVLTPQLTRYPSN